MGLLFRHDLTENGAFDLLMSNFTQWLDLVDSLYLDGSMKIWLFAFYIIAKICWPLMVH